MMLIKDITTTSSISVNPEDASALASTLLQEIEQIVSGAGDTGFSVHLCRACNDNSKRLFISVRLSWLKYPAFTLSNHFYSISQL